MNSNQLQCKQTSRIKTATMALAGVAVVVSGGVLMGQGGAADASGTKKPAKQKSSTKYKPTQYPNVNEMSIPAPSAPQAGKSGWIYVEPGAKRPPLPRASQGLRVQGAPRVAPNPQDGIHLTVDPSSMPYATAKITPQGRAQVDCVQGVMCRDKQHQHRDGHNVKTNTSKNNTVKTRTTK